MNIEEPDMLGNKSHCCVGDDVTSVLLMGDQGRNLSVMRKPLQAGHQLSDSSTEKETSRLGQVTQWFFQETLGNLWGVCGWQVSGQRPERFLHTL